MGRIYFDNAATTPVDPRVLEAMLPYFRERFGNPDSRTHALGWEAEEAVELAREQVAVLLHAEPREIVFTSGATESINLALKGALAAAPPDRRRLVTTAIEHHAVLDVAQVLEAEGVPVTRIECGPDGRIPPLAFAAALHPDTFLVSVIHGNNEIGVLQDLEALGAFCRERGVLLHVDATQSLGRVAIDVERTGVSLLSCSAHKIYGPKGVGALYVRRRAPRVQLRPLMDGGGQERGRRSGTLNVPGIVGFGCACQLCAEVLPEEAAAVTGLLQRLETGLLTRIPGARRNGSAEARLPGIANLHFEGVDGEALLLGVRDVALSLGSACASSSVEPSHVLLALGLGETVARNSIRFSLGRFNTTEEVDTVIEEVCRAVGRIRGSAATG